VAGALGDLDGFGIEEYVMDTSIGLWVFHPAGPGNWELVGQVLDPDGGSHHLVSIADVNQNGRGELIWPGSTDIQVLEYSSGWSDAPDPGFGSLVRLAISPNPCNGIATIHMPDRAVSAASIAVFDVRGRLLGREPVLRNAQGDVRWSPAGLNAGAYFVRLETKDRRPIATGRAVVARPQR
jgi:hypothetical protein